MHLQSDVAPLRRFRADATFLSRVQEANGIADFLRRGTPEMPVKQGQFSSFP